MKSEAEFFSSFEIQDYFTNLKKDFEKLITFELVFLLIEKV